MKKAGIAFGAVLLTASIVACGNKEIDEGTQNSGAKESTSLMNEITSEERITDEQALAAVKSYCYVSNPDIKEMEEAGEFPMYWEVSSEDETQIVVLFRSYTGALIRYYIDPNTGDTYVTEFVQGITNDEQKTDESFNIKDYMK